MYEIVFILLVNKQGQTRLSKYYNDNNSLCDTSNAYDRQLIESSIVRKCLSRNDTVQTNFLYHNNILITYRRYASLFFIIGAKDTSSDAQHDSHYNESTNTNTYNQANNNTNTNPSSYNTPPSHLNLLCIFELIHMVVETFDKYFSNVCELDIMFNLERAHFIIDEIIINGYICETNKKYVLRAIKLIDTTSNQ